MSDIRDEWNMECPKCKSDEEIHICAWQAVTVLLCVDGTDGDGGDTSWEDEDAAFCTACGFEGTVEDFKLRGQV